MKNKNALAVMLKAPEPGRVKTRLVPPLTYIQAARLYECMVKDTFASLSPLEGVDIFAAYHGSPHAAAGLVPEGVEPFAQTGEGLGERMLGVLRALFARGYSRSAVTGSDIPDIPPGYVADAFALLQGGGKKSLALGPATDGGYYLLAADAPYEPLFAGIRYSTPAVLEQTLDRARENSIEYGIIKPWHDIDDAGDLGRLKSNRRAPFSSAYIETLGILR